MPVDVAVDQLVNEQNMGPELELDVGLDVGLRHDVLSVIVEVHNILPEPLIWSGRKFVEGELSNFSSCFAAIQVPNKNLGNK
eukprot:12379432-Prorocentrum_lima.AAC.1